MKWSIEEELHCEIARRMTPLAAGRAYLCCSCCWWTSLCVNGVEVEGKRRKNLLLLGKRRELMQDIYEDCEDCGSSSVPSLCLALCCSL